MRDLSTTLYNISMPDGVNEVIQNVVFCDPHVCWPTSVYLKNPHFFSPPFSFLFLVPIVGVEILRFHIVIMIRHPFLLVHTSRS